MGGVPITDQWFVGGRFVYTTEIGIFSTSATTWDAGPLVGLVEQGRYGHISVGTGVAVVGGQRPDKHKTKSSTLGIPLDAQAFFTPSQHFGIGLHGYANVNPGDNLLGASLQLQVRIPQ